MLLFVNRRASPPSPMHVVQEAAISLPDSVPLLGGGEWGGGWGPGLPAQRSRRLRLTVTSEHPSGTSSQAGGVGSVR